LQRDSGPATGEDDDREGDDREDEAPAEPRRGFGIGRSLALPVPARNKTGASFHRSGLVYWRTGGKATRSFRAASFRFGHGTPTAGQSGAASLTRGVITMHPCNLRHFRLVLIYGGLLASAARGSDLAALREDVSFIGTWRVTSATNSVVLDIKPEGRALVILIQRGSHAVDSASWTPMDGGILVESIPRFRLWEGRTAEESRVEMEPLPPSLTDESMQQFPLAFFMHRVGTKRSDARLLPQRELPPHWTDAQLPPEWDQTAGQRSASASDEPRVSIP
jgi:hypothetical protein